MTPIIFLVVSPLKVLRVRLKKMAALTRLSLLSRRCTAGARLFASSSNENKEVTVKSRETKDLTEYVSPDELVVVSSLSGVPEEQLKRVARISMPSRNVMQSGTDNINHWQLEFDTQERWENPLMGWTSR